MNEIGLQFTKLPHSAIAHAMHSYTTQIHTPFVIYYQQIIIQILNNISLYFISERIEEQTYSILSGEAYVLQQSRITRYKDTHPKPYTNMYNILKSCHYCRIIYYNKVEKKNI